MSAMKRAVWLLALTVSLPALAQNRADTKEWISLFNGKNLDGWIPKIAGHPLGENYADTFRVESGILKVSYDKYPEFANKSGHLLYNTQLSYYLIVAKYS